MLGQTEVTVCSASQVQLLVLHGGSDLSTWLCILPVLLVMCLFIFASQCQKTCATTSLPTLKLLSKDASAISNDTQARRVFVLSSSSLNDTTRSFPERATSSDAFAPPSASSSAVSASRKSLSSVQILTEMRLLVSDGNLPFLTAKDEKYVIRCALVKLGARCCGKVPEDFSGSNQHWTRIKCLVCGELYQRVRARSHIVRGRPLSAGH
jgi:hypothetical protein